VLPLPPASPVVFFYYYYFIFIFDEGGQTRCCLLARRLGEPMRLGCFVLPVSGLHLHLAGHLPHREPRTP
jgi:hypothetical protein